MWINLLWILVLSSSDAQVIQRIETLMHEAIEHDMFNGTVLAARNGRMIFHRAYGWVSATKTERLTTDHAFGLASVSKPLTALAIMKLVEQGDISLDDPIQKYLPELPYQGIRMRHLLSHTSGLPDYIPLFDEHWDPHEPDLTKRRTANNRDLIQMLVDHRPKPEFAPGEKWSYNNTGFALLASIVEVVSGRSFHEFMRLQIFEPLGMERTRVYRPDQSMSKRAYGFLKRVDGTHRPFDLIFLDGIVGQCNVFSTTADLFRLDRALYGHELLTTASLNEMFAKVKLNDGSSHDYGLGWRVEMEDGSPLIGHSGDWFGFWTFYLRRPDQENTVVILDNGTDTTVEALAYAVDDLLQGRSAALPKIPVGHALGKVFLGAGAEKGRETYLHWKREETHRYDFAEFQLNGLGYQLLQLKEPHLALSAFQLNVSSFPDSANVYDSLAGCYQALGQYQAAVKNYNRSLQLNPNNSHARSELKKLSEAMDTAGAEE